MTSHTAHSGQTSELAMEKDVTVLERQTSVAPAPGAAAAEVRKAFAKIVSSSGSSSAGNHSARSGSGAPGSTGAGTGTHGLAEQPGLLAFPALGSAEPEIFQQQAESTHSAKNLPRAESQPAASAAQESKKPALDVLSDQDHFSDQPDIAALADLPTVQNTGEADGSIREQQMPGQAAAGRAMSLKGAAAADTARAFSRLRGRAGTSAAAIYSADIPASRPTSLEGKPATDAALPEEADVPQIKPTERVSEPESSSTLDLWGQKAEGSIVELEEEYQAAEMPALDLFPERPAGQMGRPVQTAGTSLQDASSNAAAAEQPSIERESTMREAPEALDTPGMTVPQSAFYQAAPERTDVSVDESGLTQNSRQSRNNEASGQMRLPHSRADLKLTSPRKRASIGRRLSGLLPGVKGKERMRAAPVTKEVCSSDCSLYPLWKFHIIHTAEAALLQPSWPESSLLQQLHQTC